jgi:secondary thiamine-phosphate synthase enzyme
LNELSAIHSARIETIARAVLTVETSGEGFVEITRAVARFLEAIKGRDGVVLLYLKHTSASLVIQENADPDVQTDLVTALDRIAPAEVKWVHDVEGPDDMPAHIKSMVNGVSLHVPVIGGKMALGTWSPSTARDHTGVK